MNTPMIVQDDQIAVVVTHLNIWRKAIQGYKNDHGTWPAFNDPEAFIDQMTNNTDWNGTVGKGEDFTFGPYINVDDMPINPFTETSAVMVVDDWPNEDEIAEDVAWIYCWNTGEFRIHSNGITADGEKVFNF